jgi:hypothetical protein
MSNKKNASPAIGRHTPAQGAAVNTGASESGKITITKDWENWEWFANGLNLLLAHSILEIGDFNENDAKDVQYVAYFSQELNHKLLRR